MNLTKVSAINFLKEVSKMLAMASGIEFNSEIDDIQKAVMRIEAENLETVNMESIMSRLIIFAKRNGSQK